MVQYHSQTIGPQSRPAREVIVQSLLVALSYTSHLRDADFVQFHFREYGFSKIYHCIPFKTPAPRQQAKGAGLKTLI